MHQSACVSEFASHIFKFQVRVARQLLQVNKSPSYKTAKRPFKNITRGVEFDFRKENLYALLQGLTESRCFPEDWQLEIWVLPPAYLF